LIVIDFAEMPSTFTARRLHLKEKEAVRFSGMLGSAGGERLLPPRR